MSDSFRLDFDDSAITRTLDSLSDAAEQDLIRPAAQAAAQVFYEQVKRNVAGLGRVTGKLSDSIYQAYRDKESGHGKAVYHVSWNFTKAPHGHLVEYGHGGKRPAPAHPFLRPAYDQAKDAATNAAVLRLESDIAQAMLK